MLKKMARFDFDAARLAIFEYIEFWYNRERIHSGIGYITPQQCEDRAIKSAPLLHAPLFSGSIQFQKATHTEYGKLKPHPNKPLIFIALFHTGRKIEHWEQRRSHISSRTSSAERLGMTAANPHSAHYRTETASRCPLRPRINRWLRRAKPQKSCLHRWGLRYRLFRQVPASLLHRIYHWKWQRSISCRVWWQTPPTPAWWQISSL